MATGFFDLLHLMGVWFSRPLGPYYGDALTTLPAKTTAIVLGEAAAGIKLPESTAFLSPIRQVTTIVLLDRQ